MLSDEEKKAIDELKEEINKPVEVPEDRFDTFILYNIESAKIVLNLIKKQSKEIEELKIQNNKLAQCHFKYEEMTGLDLLLPDKLEYISKEKSEQKEKKAYIDGTNIADKLCNKKWEDKIKAKIEELEKEFPTTITKEELEKRWKE